MSSSENLNLRITPMPDLLKLFKPLLRPDDFVQLVNMLEDREKEIKIEWRNLENDLVSMKEQCGLLENWQSSAELEKMELEEKMLTTERECEELKEKIIRLGEDEKVLSERKKRAEEGYAKVSKELSEKTSEKIKMISILKNQIVERDHSIGTSQEKLMLFEEKVAGLEREIHELKGLKLEADRTVEDMRREKSEADQKVRRRNSEAVETIEGLRREKSEADQTVEQLRRQNGEAVETIEGLRREKTEARQMVEDLKRKNTEDIETIKRLRREISTVSREKMSSNQTRAETSSKNSEEADKEMKQLRKQNFEASEIIGQLRRKVIAAEMGKMSSDQIVKEMKHKLSEAEKRAEEHKCKNLEAFQNTEDLNGQISAAVETEKTKSDKDKILKETTNKQSEVDQTVDQLRRRNLEASQIIADLKSQILAAEGDKKKSDQTLDEMKNKQSEVDQIVKELKRKYSEALRTIEELNRQKLEAEEAGRVDKKRSANMESRLESLEEGFASRKKVKVGNLDNVGKSDDKFGTTKKVEDVSMHACSGPSKIGSNTFVRIDRCDFAKLKIDDTDRGGNGSKRLKQGSDLNLRPQQVNKVLSLSSPTSISSQILTQKLAHNNDIEGEEMNLEQAPHPYTGYGIIPTHTLPQLPPFHYNKVILGGKITQRTMWSEINTMRRLMRPHHIQMLENYSQIGNFLLLSGNGKFKGAVLHNMMLRICKRKEKAKRSKYEYWFLINGKPLRFGAEEFSLVSGLRFCRQNSEDAQHIAECATLRHRRFHRWGTEKVTVEAVANEIRRLLVVNDKDDDILKLLFVWVISAVLMPTRDIKVVHELVFRVCDDLDICERYGWANEIWEATVGDILDKIGSAPEMRQETFRRWNADGCPFLILFWMLESIEGLPEVANCSSTMSQNIPSYPRMLRWMVGSGNYPNCDDVDEYFGKVKIVIPRLMPDEVESQADYYTVTRRWVDDIRPDSRFTTYRRLTNFFGDNYFIIRDEEGHPGGVNRPPHHEDAHVRQVVGSKRQRLPRRDHDASTSQSQPRPSNQEIPVSWLTELHQMEQRLLGQITGISETQQQLGVTMARLESLMLKDIQNRGIDMEEN